MAKNYPHIVTPPPGPKALGIIAQDERYASTSYIKEYPLVVARGEGAMIEDVDGNRYLDFMAGIAVASTGHSAPQSRGRYRSAGPQVLAHLLDRLLLRRLFRGLRASRQARARSGAEEGLPHQLRHRGDRGRHQARARAHQAAEHHRLSRLVPRAHHGRDLARLEQGEVPPAISVHCFPACTICRMPIRTSARSAASPRPAPTLWPARSTKPKRFSTSASRRMRSRRCSSNRSWAKAATSCRRAPSCSTGATSATSMARCSSSTRCSLASAARATMFASQLLECTRTSRCSPRASRRACRSAPSSPKSRS